MKIAILSGKGGTGKTFIAVNLAATAAKAEYLDCDVEEPNGHLFFKPGIESEEEVELMLPVVDQKICTGCRRCIEFCKFNALAYIGGKLKIFEEICHSCGGCLLVCPEKALSEGSKPIGKIQKGKSGKVDVVTGIMNVGRTTGVPIISKMIKDSGEAAGGDGAKLTIIDSPPGSACVVMESIKDADYCLLVAEPTIFGAHNLKMVHELVELFQKSCGVILNKCTDEFNPSEEYCLEHKIPIIGRIAFDHELGLKNARGEIAAFSHDYKEIFEEILGRVRTEAENAGQTDKATPARKVQS